MVTNIQQFNIDIHPLIPFIHILIFKEPHFLYSFSLSLAPTSSNHYYPTFIHNRGTPIGHFHPSSSLLITNNYPPYILYPQLSQWSLLTTNHSYFILYFLSTATTGTTETIQANSTSEPSQIHCGKSIPLLYNKMTQHWQATEQQPYSSLFLNSQPHSNSKIHILTTKTILLISFFAFHSSTLISFSFNTLSFYSILSISLSIQFISSIQSSYH